MNTLRILVRCAMVLAFCVVLLGAYTRLTNAGLGCPDWPGCYGRMLVPAQSHMAVSIEPRKAWTEMAHRYAAGTLVILLVLIALGAFRFRHQGISVGLPCVLLGLIGFQAALGMWTVTLKLLPIVVMGHLLGGFLIFGCLVYFNLLLTGKPGVNHKKLRARTFGESNVSNELRISNPSSALRAPSPRFRGEGNKVGSSLGGWANAAIVIVFLQIALGGWVSSNYAGIACVGFPQCNGQWVPQLSWMHSFSFWSPLGLNYQGGLLDHISRVTIQMMHRFGALITVVYLLGFAGVLLRRIQLPLFRRTVFGMITIVILQVVLGITNVMYFLPLWAAVAHNGMAALLFAAVLVLRYRLVTGVKYARAC